MGELTGDDQQAAPTGRLPARLLDRLAKVIDETDEQAAAERVIRLKSAHPQATAAELTERLIYHKCRDTAVIGATTSGVALVPGLGTLASLTLGLATDLGITFKMQAELVLEIAAVYGHHLTPQEKRQAVMLVTGLSAGATTLAHRAGNNISKRVTARIASKHVTKAVPIVGMAASASTNAAMTYLIGKRAQAYFSLGPQAPEDWRATAAALTGLDKASLARGVKRGGALLMQAGSTAAGKARAAIPRRHKKQVTSPTDDIIPVFDNP